MVGWDGGGWGGRGRKQGCGKRRDAGGTTLQATFAPQGLRRVCDSNSTRSAQGVGAPAIARSLRRAAPTTAHAIATGPNVNEEASLRATETATSKCPRQHVDDGASLRATETATSKRPRPHVAEGASLRATETATSNQRRAGWASGGGMALVDGSSIICRQFHSLSLQILQPSQPRGHLRRSLANDL